MLIVGAMLEVGFELWGSLEQSGALDRGWWEIDLDSTAIESLGTEALICWSSFDMEVESVKALSLMRSYVTNIFLRRKLNARTFSFTQKKKKKIRENFPI